MKISVSLPEEDVSFVDDYASETTADSRSAVIHEAIEMLRASRLEAAYAAAFAEWEGSEDAAFWDQFSADGLANSPADGLTDEAR